VRIPLRLFWRGGEQPQKEGFLKQLEGIDVKRVIDTYRQTINASGPVSATCPRAGSGAAWQQIWAVSPRVA
jgi:hypothetical protein